MSRQEFEVELIKTAEIESTYFVVPFNVHEVFGERALVKVKGTIDGVPYRGSFTNKARR